MHSSNEPLAPYGTPPTATYPSPTQYVSAPPPVPLYPASTQHASAPPPPVSLYPTSPAPPPTGLPIQNEAETSNPGMTAVPVHPYQAKQQASPKPKFRAAKKSIVQLVTNIVTIGLYYGVLSGSRRLLSSNSILLIVSAGFLVSNVLHAIMLIIIRSRPRTNFIPVLFSAVASVTLMLYFISVHIRGTERRLLFGEQGTSALLGSIGLFSGLGLGTTIIYAIYGV